MPIIGQEWRGGRVGIDSRVCKRTVGSSQQTTQTCPGHRFGGLIFFLVVLRFLGGGGSRRSFGGNLGETGCKGTQGRWGWSGQSRNSSSGRSSGTEVIVGIPKKQHPTSLCLVRFVGEQPRHRRMGPILANMAQQNTSEDTRCTPDRL